MSGAPQGRPISAARALRAMLALAARAWVNRIAAGLAARRAAKKAGEAKPRRRPTGRRQRAGIGALVLLLVPLALWQGIVISSLLIWHLTLVADRMPHVSPTTLASLRSIERLTLEPAPREAKAREALSSDYLLRDLSDSERAERVEVELEWFRSRGSAAFRPITTQPILPGPESWPTGADATMTRTVGLALAAASTLVLLLGLGLGNQDLGRVEWRMHWLATLPTTTRTLFAAKAFEYALVDPLLWGLVMPLALVALVCAGGGWWSVAVAPACAVGCGLCSGSARMAIETFLRLRWPLARLKNLQAACTIAGMALMVAVYGCAFAPDLLQRALPIVDLLPWQWTPLGWPALLLRELPWWAAIAGGLAADGLVFALAVAFCARLAAGGFVLQDTPAQGRRGGVASAWRPLPPLRRETLLLRRDRNLLVQALVVPPFILGLQLVINRAMLRGIIENPRHAATFAFALGAYSLLVTALGALATEGAGLWLLCALPQRLERFLARKTLLWASVSVAYAWGALAVAAALGHGWSPAIVGDAVLVTLGLIAYAFIATGIGALATDPLEPEPRRRVSPSAVYLVMILQAMFAQAIYADSLHLKLAQLVLSSLLAFALWQKLRDRLPYLLDPTAAPPPTIDLGDGLIAALGFLVLQGVIGLLLLPLELPPAELIAFAFATAGIVVAGSSLYVFWRVKVPDLLRAVGLRAPIGSRGAPLKAVGFGLAGALAAASVAWCWLRLLERFPDWRPAQPAIGESDLGPHAAAWLALLAVVAAPLCEEFIFRGLVFGGLARSLRWGWAALASAAIFALAHPSISVVPVFALGLAAAVAYRMSGLLLGGIIAHAGYNGLVLLMQLK